MLLESTVIPVPSELVVAPAAFRAAAGELDIWLVILLATLGADCGASINYAAGYYLGRPIIYRFANSRLGHLCLLNQHKVEKSEKYFYDHGMVATITGRLLPGIRHLISIPAGLARCTTGSSCSTPRLEPEPGTASWPPWMVLALYRSQGATPRQDYGI